MILVSEMRQGLQNLINGAKKFLDFSHIKLNHIK
jgi:hypothetical protein